MTHLIRMGDSTTTGGTVLYGATGVTIDGRAASCDGARIYCPACGSVGIARSALPQQTSMSIMGRQPLQAGDLCICGCSPPPMLVASQGIASLNAGSSASSYDGRPFDTAKAFEYVPKVQDDRSVQLAGSQGTPRNNQAQNKQTDDIARILRLTPGQARQLHDEISGEGLGYHEIMERAKDMFNLW